MRSRPRLSCSSFAHISRCDSPLERQLFALGAKRAHVLGVGAARRVARRGLEQHGALARERGLPGTPGWIAPHVDGLVGEQVRGAHQHADLGAARGERRGHRGDHRGRARVVDAAGEQHAQLGRRSRDASSRSICASHSAKLVRGPTWPPHSRPSNTKRRAPCEEQIEQARRRHVQVGRDARSSSGCACEGRPPAISATGGGMLAHDLELLLAQLRRHEAEDADAPRPAGEAPRGLASSCGPSAPRISASARNGRPRPLGDRGGERRAIADPRHRALHDCAGRARSCEARRSPSRLLAGEDDRPVHCTRDAAHHAAGSAKRSANGARTPRPGRPAAGSDASRAAETLAWIAHRRDRVPEDRAVIDAMSGDDDRLAAIHRGDAARTIRAATTRARARAACRARRRRRRRRCTRPRCARRCRPAPRPAARARARAVAGARTSSPRRCGRRFRCLCDDPAGARGDRGRASSSDVTWTSTRFARHDRRSAAASTTTKPTQAGSGWSNLACCGTRTPMLAKGRPLTAFKARRASSRSSPRSITPNAPARDAATTRHGSGRANGLNAMTRASPCGMLRSLMARGASGANAALRVGCSSTA